MTANVNIELDDDRFLFLLLLGYAHIASIAFFLTCPAPFVAYLPYFYIYWKGLKFQLISSSIAISHQKIFSPSN